MGLPVNIDVAGRYVITTERAGVNSKLIVTRLSDSRVEQLVMKETFWRFLDGLCNPSYDQTVLVMVCDELFA